jgi:hypothetical protein
MDAEDGGVAGATRWQITRACYPTPGIELELGETPVLQCSRWEPDGEQARLDSIRQGFMKSADGRDFTAKMLAFEEREAAERAAEEAEDDDVPRMGSLRSPEQQAEIDELLGDDEGTVQL